MDYDLCVIGGGINGVGIARDAAGRGLSVVLLEARDLAQATSSSSTKLIHGGLRYLEYGAFKMVREALHERERLLRAAPHVIWPLQFVLPHVPDQRPFWMIRLGLFLYDSLAGRKLLSGSRAVDFARSQVGAPLKGQYKRGFTYFDCWADDSRLVALNAMAAQENGAHILTHTRCTRLVAQDQGWQVQVHNACGVEARLQVGAVINAAGPWVRSVLEESGLDEAETYKVRLVKGSHIIVPRLYYGNHSYILQQSDKRIVFAIPYEGDYTLIGTTEEDYEGDVYDAKISEAEIDYLCAAVNAYFDKPLQRADVQWSFAGVRPLFDDGSGDATSASRDYKIAVQGTQDAPLLSVFGGKLTTYRLVAEDVVNRLVRITGHDGKPWTAKAPLPGGDIAEADFDAFLAEILQQYGFLDDGLLRRYARAYGTRVHVLLGQVASADNLGVHYGDGLYEIEVRYLVRAEFARSSDDILWRRSKMGIHVSARTVTALKVALPALLTEEGIDHV